MASSICPMVGWVARDNKLACRSLREFHHKRSCTMKKTVARLGTPWSFSPANQQITERVRSGGCSQRATELGPIILDAPNFLMPEVLENHGRDVFVKPTTSQQQIGANSATTHACWSTRCPPVMDFRLFVSKRTTMRLAAGLSVSQPERR